MNNYRKNSYKAGRFTSDGFVVTAGRSYDYEPITLHNGAALLVFLVPALGIVAFIVAHLS